MVASDGDHRVSIRQTKCAASVNSICFSINLFHDEKYS